MILLHVEKTLHLHLWIEVKYDQHIQTYILYRMNSLTSFRTEFDNLRQFIIKNLDRTFCIRYS